MSAKTKLLSLTASASLSIFLLAACGTKEEKESFVQKSTTHNRYIKLDDTSPLFPYVDSTVPFVINAGHKRVTVDCVVVVVCKPLFPDCYEVFCKSTIHDLKTNKDTIERWSQKNDWPAPPVNYKMMKY